MTAAEPGPTDGPTTTTPRPPTWPTERIDLDAVPRPAPTARWLGHQDEYEAWVRPHRPSPGPGARLIDRPASFDRLILPESSLAESDLVASTRDPVPDSPNRAGPGPGPAGAERSAD